MNICTYHAAPVVRIFVTTLSDARVWRADRAPIAPRALLRWPPHPPPLRPIGARPPPAAGRIRRDHVGRPARILLLELYGQNDADEQQRVGQTSTREVGGIENLRANGSGALLSHGTVCGRRAAVQQLMWAVHAGYEGARACAEWGPLLGSRGRARARSRGGRSKGLHPAGDMRARARCGARAGKQCAHEHARFWRRNSKISTELNMHVALHYKFCSATTILGRKR